MKKPINEGGVPLRSVRDEDQDECSVHAVVEELIEEDDGVVIGFVETDEPLNSPREFCPPVAVLQPFDFDSLAVIQQAHDKVAAVLKEGTSNLPKAFSSNLARDRQNWKDGLIGTVIGGASALLAGDPIFFFLAAPVGFMIRNAWNTLRIRSKKDKLVRRNMQDMDSADLPELKSAWDLTCYKFIRLVRGYNARVYAVNSIRENQLGENGEDLLVIADKWRALLLEAFERLDYVCADLQRHKMLLISKLSHDLEELDDTLRHQDFLGYFDGVAVLDWLDLDSEYIKGDRILLSRARQVFRADMEARAELQERNEMRKQSFEDVEDFIRDTEPVFDDLEREHGEVVQAMQDKDKENDDS